MPPGFLSKGTAQILSPGRKPFNPAFQDIPKGLTFHMEAMSEGRGLTTPFPQPPELQAPDSGQCSFPGMGTDGALPHGEEEGGCGQAGGKPDE